MMRILHLLNGEVLSGPEQVVMSLMRHPSYCARSMAALFFDGMACRRMVSCGFEVHLLPMSSRLDLRVVRRLVDLVRQNDISLIHTHTWRANLVGRMAAVWSKLPVVTTIHSPVSRESTRRLNNALNALVERTTAPLTDAFITVSECLRQELLRSGIDASKIWVVHNGIEVSDGAPACGASGTGVRAELGIPRRAPAVAMVAMFRPRKGAHILVEAAAGVTRVVPEVRFVLIGSGDMAPAYYNGLRRQVTSLGLERHVIFTGYREDALRVLSQLDVLVLPALFGEGLPIVILEAMALAKPVVATRVEGISEVVRDAETGVLVAPGDASALSQAILTMIRNRELAGQMGTRGHERFLHEFTADVMARKVEPVYRYVLGGDHRPGSREPRRD